MTEHGGSCLCGQVRFEIDGTLGEIGHCHCRMCQKAHGAAYATYVNVPLDRVRFVAGEAEIGRYESSPGIIRTFCRQCGSTLQFLREGAVNIGVAAAAFDTDPGQDVNYEIWTSSAAPWGHRDELPLTHPTQPGKVGGG